MKNAKPLVSIILPVHNSQNLLRECLESLVSQTYRNLEIIAIDDGSSDNSYKILKTFAKRYRRLRTYRNVKRYGIAVTLNRLIKKAKGEMIAFMDQDDIASKSRIKKEVKFLLEHPEIVAVGSQCVFIDRENKRLGKSQFPLENSLIYQSPLHGISMQFETVLVNRKLLPYDLLRFDTNSNPFIYSDVFLKLLPYGKFANLKNFLHYHRNPPRVYLLDLLKNPFSFIKLWLKSVFNYNYHFSIQSFFLPFLKQI